MLSQIVSASFLSMFIQIFVTALFFIILRKKIIILNRKTAFYALLIWCLLVTIEYWLLGQKSFVILNDEGEFSLPLTLYLVHWYKHGTFAHGVMGGVDAKLLYGSQYLSLELLLFSALPSWVAMAVHKVMVVGVAASGAYLLARRGAGTERVTAVALAMMVVLAHRYSLTVTVHHGLGYALTPWAAYVLVYRSERRLYWLWASLLAFVHAISSSATHSTMSFAMGAVTVWMFTGRRHPVRFWGGLALIGLMAFINWHETLFAMAQNGADSFRGTQLATAAPFWWMATTAILHRMTELVPLTLAALFWLAVHRSPKLWCATGMFLAVALSGPLIQVLPWQSLGVVSMLGAIDFTYTTLGLTAVAVMVIGWASRVQSPPFRLPLLVRATFAVAIGALAWHKTWHAIQWFGMGGQSILGAYENLEKREWAPSELFRVVSVPYRLEPNTVAAYGLETFDGLLNVVPASRSLFWRDAFPAPNPAIFVGYNYITHQNALDFLCCTSYPLDRIAPLDTLRLANVGFLLSLMPIDSPDLTQVSGPDDRRVPPRRGDSVDVRLKGLAAMLLGKVDVYVYRVPDPLPRAHMATRIETAQAAPGSAAIAAVAQLAVSGAAVVVPEAAAGLHPDDGAKVSAVVEIPDGYAITVSAPQGGVLLLNQLWRPYWQVLVDGVMVAPPVEANLIEMAVDLPAGASQVEFLYKPPLLRQTVLGMLAR